MKSIKPGRGPSMMGGVVGIFMICFGILWTILAAQASPVFSLFGVLWTGIAVVNTVYDFKNAKSKNRYSDYDITDENEEPDPLNQRYGGYGQGYDQQTFQSDTDSGYCPYCGMKVEGDYRYCTKCGKKLP